MVFGWFNNSFSMGFYGMDFECLPHPQSTSQVAPKYQTRLHQQFYYGAACRANFWDRHHLKRIWHCDMLTKVIGTSWNQPACLIPINLQDRIIFVDANLIALLEQVPSRHCFDKWPFNSHPFQIYLLFEVIYFPWGGPVGVPISQKTKTF